MGRFLRQALRLLSSEVAHRLPQMRCVYFSLFPPFSSRTSNLKLFRFPKCTLNPIGIPATIQDATDNCLAGTGVTHLVVNSGAVDYYVRRGLDPRRVYWDRFPDFERRCLETIASAPGVSFYRLR